MIDDLYSPRHRGKWEEELRDLLSIRTPPVAIITCGPSEQARQLDSQLGDLFSLHNFCVPSEPSHEEIQEFADWFHERTGEKRDVTKLTQENPIIVQVLFELAQNKDLKSFTLRFKDRLSDRGLDVVAPSIFAINSLYTDAPWQLLTTEEQRVQLEELCQKEQLHFQHITAYENDLGMDCVRLAHPHLAWQFCKILAESRIVRNIFS